jgi:hypothetical protein
VTLTCPNCGNDRNFLVKTLQMHVVNVEAGRVEVSEESRPAVLEVLCDECDLRSLPFRLLQSSRSQGKPIPVSCVSWHSDCQARGRLSGSRAGAWFLCRAGIPSWRA